MWACFSKKDVANIQGLSDTIKMELMVEIAYHMFHGASLITMENASLGELISLNSLLKENEHWRIKCGDIIYEQTSLQEKESKL